MWVGSYGSQQPGHMRERRKVGVVCVWEENRYNFMCMCELSVWICLHICIVVWHREAEIWQCRIYDCSVYTGWTNTTYTWRKGKLVKLWSLIYLKCLSPVFVYPHGFIYSHGPDTLGSWGGGNDLCGWKMLCSAASPCLRSTWWICRRTGPPSWPGTDWHMSGEGGVKKRGGEVTDLLDSVIKCSPCPSPPWKERKHLLQCSLPTRTPPTPWGHGQLECLPLPHTVLPVQPRRTKPNTNNTNLSTVAPLWATHPVTDKLKYH